MGGGRSDTAAASASASASVSGIRTHRFSWDVRRVLDVRFGAVKAQECITTEMERQSVEIGEDQRLPVRVGAAAALVTEKSKRVARFIDEHVTQKLRIIVDNTKEKMSIRGAAYLPLASTVLAPDASHPHVTSKFAPSLPKPERDSLRKDIAKKLKGTNVNLQMIREYRSIK